MDGGKARITVIGSYAVGMTISCARFPTEGETVPGRNFNMLHGGKGSNQAIAAARLGGAATFGTAVGTDTFGDQAIAMLKGEGIGIDFVVRKPGHSTGVGLVMVSDKGSNEIVIDLGANDALSVADIDAMKDTIAASDLLLVQLECNLDAVVRAVDLAAASNVPVILNPAPFRKLPAATLAKATYLTPNETEATALLDLPQDTILDGAVLATRLFERYGTTIVVTLGEKGAHVRSASLDRAVPTYPAKCIDSTGSGDTFSGALAVALGEGKDLVAAVSFANMAASMSVEVEGVVEGIPHRAEVDRRLAQVSRSIK
ncbi:MAG: PfkB domain protein [Proteobacteria bacterium]|nr:PfkB domain protein [Pseudomonadota bacterium]